MRIKRGDRSNKFCGPAALSLLTGRHVDECVRSVHLYRECCGLTRFPGRRNVRSMDKDEILRVLNQMGYTINSAFHSEVSGLRMKDTKKPTLVALMRWLKRQDRYSPKKKYLILVTGHYVVMKGIKLFDNANPNGVFFGKYNGRRRRVSQAWDVSKAPASPSV